MRLRWTKADKKHIARYQNQEIIEKDIWLGTTRIIGYKCKKCRREIPLDILEVDHIIPVSKGGKDNPDNLRLLCPTCNKKKGASCKASTAKNQPSPKPIATQKKTTSSTVSGKSKTTSAKPESGNKRSPKLKKKL
jgi:hypothetical protein